MRESGVSRDEISAIKSGFLTSKVGPGMPLGYQDCIKTTCYQMNKQTLWYKSSLIDQFNDTLKAMQLDYIGVSSLTQTGLQSNWTDKLCYTLHE